MRTATNVWSVARRELRSYFDHPTAYILLVAFLALGLFLSFRTLYATGVADLRAFFDLLPWLFMVFIPAITMRSLAEERGRGTLEWLLSQPLTEVELVVGKFLGDWIFALVALAGTLPMAVGVLLLSELGPGIVLAQYVGGALLAAQLVALGLAASALTRNQITAFILAAALAFALVLAGHRVVLLGLPPALSAVVTRLAVIPHYESVARGVIDLRDALYFLSTAALFLVGAHALVTRLRLVRTRGAWRRLRLGAGGLAVVVVVLNLLGGEIHGRIDLTRENLYTLSPGTRDLLSGLDDLVTIRLYVSEELPPEIQMTRRDVEDLLDDYRRFSDGNVRVEVLDPGDDPTIAEQAREAGIREIEFNVLREDEFQIRRGWFGLTIQYADRREAIPVLRRSDDLEYRLTSAIAAMTAARKPVLAFATGFGARDAFQLQPLRQALSERYEVNSLELEGDSLSAPEIPSPDSVDVLALVGPSRPLDEAAVAAVEGYLEAGGAALLLLDGIRVEQGRPVAVRVRTGLEPLLARHGLRIDHELLADYRSNQRISMGGQGIFSIVRSYPLWPVLLPAGDHVITRGLEGLGVAWASPITILDSARTAPLWSTTRFTDVLPPGSPIQPEMIPEPVPANLSTRVAGAAVREVELPGGTAGDAASGDAGAAPDEAGASSGADDDGDRSDRGGRLVVVGDADLLDPQFLRASGQNLAFVSNAIDWLAQDESLIAIRSKDRTPPALLLESDLERLLLRWGNLAGVPLLFVLLGVVRSLRRRRRSEKLWKEIVE